ncbi:MAG: ParB/RepB/Spo0J family partition protein [Bacteroidetes bacterium]|nr:ParB/RepB/Spo0J family partition protein [Bacteroidota bacterium]MBX7044435.1 ParB/RepB/Spo0J family partition protein [Ignavibacteria bacterium]
MERNTGLGKGLSALFTERNIDPNIKPDGDNKTSLIEIEIDKIKTNPFQPRVNFNEEKLLELADSILSNGVIQPITVKRTKDLTGYELISGERRLRASQKAGLKKIPAYIYEKEADSPQTMLELALIENIQRDDLNAMELSDTYQKLVDDFNLTQEEIAKRVSKNRATVANYLRLQKLIPEVKVSLRENEISEGHARILLRMENPEEQKILWRSTIENKLSVRKLEDLTQSEIKPKLKKKTAKIDFSDSYIRDLETKLMRFFGTRVKINTKKNKSGEIVIEYYNDDDLERIIDKCN